MQFSLMFKNSLKIIIRLDFITIASALGPRAVRIDEIKSIALMKKSVSELSVISYEFLKLANTFNKILIHLSKIG